MRYLCGHGRAFKLGAVAIVGAMVAGAASAEESSSATGGGNAAAECARSGVLFVGPGLTYSVMSCGMFAGVTLSINCHEGSSSTIELWSEWFGMGMSEAESMSFY